MIGCWTLLVSDLWGFNHLRITHMVLWTGFFLSRPTSSSRSASNIGFRPWCGGITVHQHRFQLVISIGSILFTNIGISLKVFFSFLFYIWNHSSESTLRVEILLDQGTQRLSGWISRTFIFYIAQYCRQNIVKIQRRCGFPPKKHWLHKHEPAQNNPRNNW